MKLIRKILGRSSLTASRRESNRWLRLHAGDITGKVLSIGSGDDKDKEGGGYRNYFRNASSYTTSEIEPMPGCDLVLDVRSMPEIPDGAYDCVFCSGVLEHVDDWRKALQEITRVLKPGGTLLLGLPFRQPIHFSPRDYWRFTEHGIREMLRRDYEILALSPMDEPVPDFPAAYWVKAKKRGFIH